MPPPGWCLVVGHHALLNQLLANAIQSELGVDCRATDDWSAVAAAGGCLLLVDDTDPAARAALLERLASSSEGVVAALFDVDPALSDQGGLIRRGVLGLFLRSDPVPRVLGGVRSLLRGEPWIPFENALGDPGDSAASRLVPPGRPVTPAGTGIMASRPDTVSAQPPTASGPDARDRLTAREREVLALLCAGATNDQVGRRLGLSTNTVKAHLYSIYKKIDVRSRTHAALWAVRFLGETLSLTTQGPPDPGEARKPH